MPFLRCIRDRFALIPILLAAASAASAQVSWTRIDGPKALVPDDNGVRDRYPVNSRLVCDKENNLYLSLGDSLHIRDAYGETWRTAPRKAEPFPRENVALAVGSNGLAVWGGGVSADRGRSWDDMKATYDPNPSALAVLPNGNILQGISYDILELSVDSGRSWKQVYMGRNHGQIQDIATSVDGWTWAASQVRGLLVSRDFGMTWATADSIIGGVGEVGGVGGVGGAGFAAHFLAPTRTDNAVFAYQPAKPGKGRIVEFEWAGQSGTAKSYPITAGFADSAVTDLEWSRAWSYTQEHGLWAGTWGQGVWHGRDGGTHWAARNQGLGDLFVKGIASCGDGGVYALTRSGLHAMAVMPSILIVPKASRGASARKGGGLFRAGSGWEATTSIGSLFRADGRKTRLLSTEKPPAVGAP